MSANGRNLFCCRTTPFYPRAADEVEKCKTTFLPNEDFCALGPAYKDRMQQPSGLVDRARPPIRRLRTGGPRVHWQAPSLARSKNAAYGRWNFNLSGAGRTRLHPRRVRSPRPKPMREQGEPSLQWRLHAFGPGSVSLLSKALGPVHPLRGVILFRDKSSDGFTPPSDHNFLSCFNPTQ